MRLFTWVLVAILAGLLGLYSYGCFWIGAPAYSGPVTENFDGARFHNVPPVERNGFAGFLKWTWTRKPGPWLEWVEAEPGPPPPERVGAGEMRATFVNHSTVLVQMDGLNILTDPVWSERIGPVSWAGPKRHRLPGIRFEDLPPIDVVLVSHSHYDHMDMPTLIRLRDEHGPRFYTGLGNRAVLAEEGIEASAEMDWWDETEIAEGVTLAFVPARHFSGRSLCDRNRTLWGGFVIKGPAGTVYFAGDTGAENDFERIRDTYGAPRLAMIPIGAFLPAWFMSPVHTSPAQAVEVHERLHAGTSIPIHYGTFRLGDDGQFEPVERLANALIERPQVIPNFWVLGFGEGGPVPSYSSAKEKE